MDMQPPAPLESEAPVLSCLSCGSAAVHASHVRSAFWQDERLVVVEGIPALVCDQCGEQFYDDCTAIGLDILRGTGFPDALAVRRTEVAVFDFGQAPALKNAT